jgi:hypothetical protein
VSVALYSLIGKYEWIDAFRSLITVVEENPIHSPDRADIAKCIGRDKSESWKNSKLLYFKNHRKYKLRFYRNPSFDGWVHFREIY